MNECSILYYIPSRSEFLKIQPGTGDNLSPEDISAGFTDYILWNRFVPGPLDIDGELELSFLDGGMLLLEPNESVSAEKILKKVLEYAYGSEATHENRFIQSILLCKE